MDKENDFSFQPGTELAAQRTEKLIVDLRETYRILRLFGAVQLTFAVLALLSFPINLRCMTPLKIRRQNILQCPLQQFFCMAFSGWHGHCFSILIN